MGFRFLPLIEITTLKRNSILKQPPILAIRQYGVSYET
jgi:hypothetical protein